MQAALRQNRSRLVVLLIADACLLVVGAYLIFSWARRPARSAPARTPPSAPGGASYVNWDDDGTPGRIATGPLEATFTPSMARSTGTMTSTPTKPSGSTKSPLRRTPGNGSAATKPGPRSSALGR